MPGEYQHLLDRAQERGQYEGIRRSRIPLDANADPWVIPIEQLNVANPELFKHNLHADYFTRLRAEAPVHYCAESQYGPYWSITRYDDIMEVEKNTEVFSSSFEYGGITIMGTVRGASQIPMFIQMDSPVHEIQRRTLQPKFSMRALAELEDTIRSRAGAILDDLPLDSEFNWVERVSVDLTGRMLATLFDIPQEDRKLLIRWSDTFGGADNPEVVSHPDGYLKTLAEAGEYFIKLWKERSKNTLGTDLISMLAHSQGTKDMNADTFLGNLVLLIVGGNDTTRNSISGGVLALNEFPEQYDKLRKNPDLIESMVPEIIRWQVPLPHMRRTATRDIEFRGQDIKAGDKVVLWYISANRDEAAIDQPNQFIIDRKRPREHLSFGFGIHRCLGNRLAEMQLKVLWQEIMKRFSRVEVCGEPERVNSCLINGYHNLPVRVHV